MIGLIELQDLLLAMPALGVIAALFLVFMKQERANTRDLRNELRDVRSEVRDSRDDIRDGNETLALILAQLRQQNGQQRIKRKRRPKVTRVDVRARLGGGLQHPSGPLLGGTDDTGADVGTGG